MLDVDSNPYVMDFSLAKRDAGEITITVEGRVFGAPAYTSPLSKPAANRITPTGVETFILWV